MTLPAGLRVFERLYLNLLSLFTLPDPLPAGLRQYERLVLLQMDDFIKNKALLNGGQDEATTIGPTGLNDHTIQVNGLPLMTFKSTGHVGIGTEEPRETVGLNLSLRSTSVAARLMLHCDDGANGKEYTWFSASDGALAVYDFTDDAYRLYLYETGDFGVGTLPTDKPTANGGKVFMLADNGADPTMVAGICGVYNKAGEIYHIDGSGNISLQSPHTALNAPPALHHVDDVKPPEITMSYNQWVGAEITWKRNDDRLTSTIRESFDDYNLRLGLTQGEPDFFELLDWTDHEQGQQQKRQEEHVLWEQRRDDPQRRERFEEPEPLPYVLKQPPASLARYGLVLRDQVE